MITYRVHIYSLAMAASAEATNLALSLFQCATKLEANSPGAIDETLPDLRNSAASLRTAVDRLREALPLEVREGDSSNLVRHLYFIDYWLNKRLPRSCMGDPVDIAAHDLPDVLKLFELWYERQSPTDYALNASLEPQITSGQLNAALREAWPVFKTRMVNLFGLADDLDGDKLASKLFGSNGATVGLLSDGDREGYLNLFKGLYALSRNPVVHNDIPANPEETSAVLALINSALVRLEGVRGTTAFADKSRG